MAKFVVISYFLAQNNYLLSTERVDYVEEPMKYQALRPHFFSMVGWGGGVGGGGGGRMGGGVGVVGWRGLVGGVGGGWVGHSEGWRDGGGVGEGVVGWELVGWVVVVGGGVSGEWW